MPCRAVARRYLSEVTKLYMTYDDFTGGSAWVSSESYEMKAPHELLWNVIKITVYNSSGGSKFRKILEAKTHFEVF